MRSGATELAVVTLAPLADPLLASERLWRDPLAFVAATDHPLSQQQQIPLAQLAEYPAILPGLVRIRAESWPNGLHAKHCR